MNNKIELNEAFKNLKDIELALNESSIVAITDKRGVIQYANDKFCEISKYSREELIGSKQSIVNSGYHSREFFKEMWRTIGTGNVWKGEIKNTAKDGSYYWVDTTIVPILNEKGRPHRYIAIRHDITKLKEYEEKIKQMAFTDSLTMLPNRYSLTNWIECSELDTGNLSVMFLDIDRFKSINDTYGHTVGDLLLKEVGRRLKNCTRPTDFIVRQGGDEFIIFLNETTNKNEIKTIANKILEELRFPYFINGTQIYLSASIGISMNTSNEYDINEIGLIDTLICEADTAMYHSKKLGGNSYCFNTSEQNHQLQRYNCMEQELKLALSQNQFFVVYQPIYRLKDHHIVGVEALLRWDNPRFGTVTPDEFIPILEEIGEIVPVGKWVLKTVCSQLQIWHNKGIFIERVAVNVSPIQLIEHNFVEDVKQIIDETGIHPSCLELEITEGTILNISKVDETLNELRNLGVHISIDDFGTGYSSLSYLKKLPITTLKIDRSFIRDLDLDEEVIVNTIISMGKNLKFKVVAEGIESDEQLSYLQLQKCDEGQGFFWSKPVEVDQIEKIYRANKREEVQEEILNLG